MIIKALAVGLPDSEHSEKVTACFIIEIILDLMKYGVGFKFDKCENN